MRGGGVAVATSLRAEGSAPQSKRTDDGSTIPVTAKDAASWHAADWITASSEQPSSTRVAVDRPVRHEVGSEAKG